MKRAVILIALFIPTPLVAQPGGDAPPPPVFSDTVRIVPQKDYDRGGTHRFFFGDLWRDAWGTEIAVPVLDLERTGGGLTVDRLGGGTQTTSIRFRGEDGREYKFRSIDKDPSGILPESLQETVVDAVLQDMIASGSPVGPLVVAPILDAVEIPNPRPWIAVLPDDPRLGEHREKFAGMLGTLEVHPNEGPDDTPGFMGYEKIVGWDDLFENMREENDEVVDHVEFLKASLVDMLVGDWDRHYDQWRWAEIEKEGVDYWVPIPRDRDQALSRFDGLLGRMAVRGSPELEHIDEEYRSIEELTWAGRYLDRRMLPPVSKEIWDSVTRYVVAHVTDSVIAEAVSRMPAEIRAIEGEKTRKVLTARRDLLPGASQDLYHLINTEPELWGSDQEEFVLINRIDDDRVRVRFYRKGKEDESEYGPYIDRTFDRSVTKEIRLTLLGDDDSVVVDGHVESSIPVKVDGGDGKDIYIDKSKVDGYFFITPIPDAETATYFYDHGNKSTFVLGAGTRIDRGEYPLWEHDSVAWHPPLRDYGSTWRILPWLGYDSDAGLFLGAKYLQTRFGYRQNPYTYEFSLGAGYAIGSRAYTAEFDGEFRHWVPNASVFTNLRFSELEILNYFGLGNETELRETLDEDGYYNISQKQVLGSFDLQIPRRGSFALRFGLFGEYAHTQLDRSPILAERGEGLYGVEPTLLGGVSTGVRLDLRDDPKAPGSGFWLKAGTEVYPEIFDAREAFLRWRSEGRAYVSWDLLRPTTLALRAATERVEGENYPFYRSAFLGGSGSLRTYDRNRFAGDRMAFGNAELRLHLIDLELLTRNRIGLLLFGEGGRVWLDGEESDDWHYGYGGGLSLQLRGTDLIGVVSAGRSAEGDVRYVFSLGYLY